MESLPRELEIILTADGSPTICLGGLENMHNSQGALSESLYIYGHGLEQMLSWKVQARVISVGLGLGYNEMIAFALTLKHQQSLQLWSFETFAYLRRSMEQWLIGEDCALFAIYDQILLGVAQKLEMSAREIKNAMTIAIKNRTWQIRGGFPEDSEGINSANCILYDAFSAKTCPELWEEQSLQNNLRPLLAPQTVFVTYAATGSLKRALSGLDFSLPPRAGFAGKRDSTLGIRNS
jgi:tRNA U34 5-methylaminomethyl-2-thiouridine-forming methyltransferase MnmC